MSNTNINEIAMTFACPHCEVKSDQRCINTKNGKPAQFTHAARINQICRAQFLEGIQISPFCAKLAGHRNQHATHNGNLRWSAGYSYEEVQQLVDAQAS